MLHGSLGRLSVLDGSDPLVTEELGGIAHGQVAPSV